MSDIAEKVLETGAPPLRDDAAFNACRVAVFTREEVIRCRHWPRAFAKERKDRRYYELVEDTIHPEFDYRYFVIQDQMGHVRAVQPFFVLDQDMLAGSGDWTRAVAEFIRRFWPGFLMLRTLMVGCAAGEGHLDGSAELPRSLHAALLAKDIAGQARKLGARLVVLKEFPARERENLKCFLANGYTRVPSMPMTRASIGYADFDEYMQKMLSRKTRARLRAKFRATERTSSLKMTVLRDITPLIDEVYPLYLDVYERSSLRFEKLTKAFFCEIGRRMPDKARFYVWRNDGKIVAFGLCMIERDSLCAEYIGFDYSVAHKLNLYYVAVRDVMGWAMANGYKSFRSTGLNYEPKLNLRYLLDPLDLYVKHTAPIFNFALKYVLPLVEPTRHDKILPKFPNYKELWPRRK